MQETALPVMFPVGTLSKAVQGWRGGLSPVEEPVQSCLCLNCGWVSTHPCYAAFFQLSFQAARSVFPFAPTPQPCTAHPSLTGDKRTASIGAGCGQTAPPFRGWIPVGYLHFLSPHAFRSGRGGSPEEQGHPLHAASGPSHLLGPEAAALLSPRRPR